MLIKVFGVWLMASNITSLNSNIIIRNNSDSGTLCRVFSNGKDNYVLMSDHSCDEVAAEINKQIKGKE